MYNEQATPIAKPCCRIRYDQIDPIVKTLQTADPLAGSLRLWPVPSG